jgi:ion channel
VSGVKLVLPGRRNRTLASGGLVPIVVGTLFLVVVSAAAAAAFETRTVSSFWRGMWWAVSLITTVGFIGEPPETWPGEVLSAVLMVVGFLLLAVVSASLAALFVHEEERPWEESQSSSAESLTAGLARLEQRLTAIEAQLERLGEDVPDGSMPLPPAVDQRAGRRS